MKNSSMTPVVMLLAILLSACNSGDSVVSSSNIATNEIYSTMELHADGSGMVYVGVQLTKDQPPSDTSSSDEYIELSAADELWFTSGVNMRDLEIEGDLFDALAHVAKTQELVEGTTRFLDEGFFWSRLFPIQTYYDGSLEVAEEGATYTVSLLREGGIDAKSSTVTMPFPFEIVAPLPGETYSRSQDSILVEWLPFGADVQVELEANTSCPDGSVDSYTTTQAVDNGFLLLNAGDLMSDNLSGSCSTSLTLAKSRLGQPDPAFVGGFISAHQVRTVSVTTTD
jgi:hypothetical protein